MYNLISKKYIDIFNNLGQKYDHERVFYDFIKMSSIAIYNSFAKNEELENQYISIINHYEKNDQELFAKLLAELIMMYEKAGDIVDILGQFYMNERFGNSKLGQCFTPSHISDLMAEVSIGDESNLKNDIKEKGFVTLYEPCCGSSGMILSFVKALQKRNINYQQQLLVQAEDISDKCIYMSYLQLSLYGIPAILCCGDVFSRKMNFCLQTPSFYLQYWKFKKFFKQEANKKTIEKNNTEKIKQAIIIDKPIIDNKLFKEVTIKGNTQISLW